MAYAPALDLTTLFEVIFLRHKCAQHIHYHTIMKIRGDVVSSMNPPCLVHLLPYG